MIKLTIINFLDLKKGFDKALKNISAAIKDLLRIA